MPVRTCLRPCRELELARDAGEPSVEAVPDVDGVLGSISRAPLGFPGVAGASTWRTFPLSSPLSLSFPLSGLRGTHDGGARFFGGGTMKGPRCAAK